MERGARDRESVREKERERDGDGSGAAAAWRENPRRSFNEKGGRL